MELIENLPKTTTASTAAMQPADIHRQVEPKHMTVKEIASALNVGEQTVRDVITRLGLIGTGTRANSSRGNPELQSKGYTEQQCWRIAQELAKSHNKKDNETVKSAVQTWTLDKVIEILNPWTSKVDVLLKELQEQNAELTTRNTELTTNVVQLARDLSTVSLLAACKHKGPIRTQLNRVEYDTDALLQELRERLANG